MTWLFGPFLLAGGLISVLALKPDSFTAFNTQTSFNVNVPLGLSGLSTQGAGGFDCPQSSAIHPTLHRELNEKLNGIYGTEGFKSKTYETLGGAIRVPTESYDGMGPVGKDARWKVFSGLHTFLEDRFKRLYSDLVVTKVNTYGLVFHWQGSDDSLLPILLTAHQGTWIWGRGSCDDKSSLIAILVVIEELLNQGFTPKRTIVVAFGFDEESAGTAGAGQIAKYLETRYGRDSFATLLDEGSGFQKVAGGDVIFAVPSTSEKGYTDILVEVSTQGGHSSVPPKHTSIGILSSAIVAIESSEHTPQLLRNGTPFATYQCIAEYGPDIPDSLRKLVKRAAEDDDALDQLKWALIDVDPINSAMFGTTQAVDLIRGGVKVNALPESASAVVNHRIAEHSSVVEVRKHLTQVLRPVAEAFDLTLDSFGVNVTEGSRGRLTIGTAFGAVLEPSPVTPTGLSGPYAILSGTIKATLEGSEVHPSKSVVVSPMLAMGNTDTRFYWNLTKHIFRYAHFADDDAYNGYHTVNEAIRAEALIEEIQFLTTFVLNWDEATI